MGRRKKISYEIKDLALEKLVNGGQALGYSDGKPVFVWGGLPGEVVDVHIGKAKRGVLEGIVTKVSKVSPERVEPREPEEYLSTSPWQILDPKKEDQVKLELLAQTFKHEAGVDLGEIEFVGPDSGKEFGYRNKMEYVFWGDEDGLHLALHKRGSGQKIMLEGSALASEAINKAGSAVVDLLNKKKVFAGDLKSLVLRSNLKGECVGALFIKTEDFKEFEIPTELKGLVCYYSNPKSPASVITKELWREGVIDLSEQVSGLEIAYDVNSFFQVNLPIFEKTLDDIRTNLLPDLPILDFYGGVGSIGLSIAGKNRALSIVEINEQSVEMARKNIASLKLSNAVVASGASEDALDEIWADSILVVDPPRAGLHKKVVQHIAEVKPKQIIYLSCNPVTQARDVKFLIEAGYRVSFARGYNFFPRTPHVESLVVLEC